jgi:hypothetical protein
MLMHSTRMDERFSGGRCAAGVGGMGKPAHTEHVVLEFPQSLGLGEDHHR